jgi:hypothetical protein
MGWKDKVASKVWGAVMGKGKVSPDIKSVKPKLTKGESTKVWGQKLRGKFKKKLDESTEDIDKVLTSTNKLIQKVEGKPITKSGFSKGKDLKK